MSNLFDPHHYLQTNGSLRAALGITPEAQLEPTPLGMGEHNKNYCFADPATGKRYVLRINVLPQPFHSNQVRYEYDALKALESCGVVPRALYVDDGPTAPAYGALVEEFCEGQMLDFDHLRPGDLRCAAQLMADYHAVKLPRDCGIFKPKDPLQELFDECMDRYDYYLRSGYEDERVTRWMERYIKATRPVLNTPCSPEDCQHIINSETLASHFLIPAASAAEAADAPANGTGRFCAHPGTFVDWERPLIGEVAQDLAFFVAPSTTYWDSDFMFPRKDIESFLDDYWRAVDGRFACGSFEPRFWAFLKLSVLRSAMWCCKAIARYSGEGSQHQTAKTQVKLPIYLSDEFNERLFDEIYLND